MRPSRMIRSANRVETFDDLGFPSNFVQTQMPIAVFTEARRRTGPKGPSKELVDAIVEMKRRVFQRDFLRKHQTD